MVGAISVIEAPLKFQAPGITIPLGLGIGRLVFFALNIAEAIILISLTLAAFRPGTLRLAGRRLGYFVSLAVLFLVKVLVVRPPLNARTDQVLEGADPGESPWHYIYIAFDVASLVILVLFALSSAKKVLAL